jgi:hypothetical protein
LAVWLLAARVIVDDLGPVMKRKPITDRGIAKIRNEKSRVRKDHAALQNRTIVNMIG